jgi:hypothetical protein
MQLYQEVIIELLHNFLFFCACVGICHYLPSKNIKNLPTFIQIFIGAFPFILIQNSFSFIFWNSPTDPFWVHSFLHVLKSIYLCVGLVYFVKSLKDSNSKILLSYLIYFIPILLIFLPSILLRSSFHPSWDSDVIIFWYRKLQLLHNVDFLQARNETIGKPDYISYLLSLFTFSFTTKSSPLALIIALRFVLCALCGLALKELTQYLTKEMQLFLCVALLCGFPLKWVNFYQDCWLGVIILFWFQHILFDKEKKSPLACFLILGILSALKNEGSLYSIALTFITLFLYRKNIIKNPKNLIALFVAFLPILMWKLNIYFNHLQPVHIHSIDYETLFQRLIQMFSLYLKGLGRQYQSWLLEATLCAFFIFFGFKRNTESILLFWCCFFILISMPLGVVLFTNLEFDWLLRTTFSRITIPACFLTIYMWSFEMNRRLVYERESKQLHS